MASSIAYPGDSHLFAVDQAYVHDSTRPTLSLSYKSASGGLVTTVKPMATRLPAFFSNLLPEGALRDYLAAKAGVKPGRESSFSGTSFSGSVGST
ncbi:MAG: HipA N-terminal domain-containing protein [Alphaproteobacteria bacterium]|nr:HipA N-terminal domain-containing protein [Alphaproteobacteria bacterium]